MKNYTWTEVTEMARGVAAKAFNQMPKPILVYGIPRGGAIVAGILQALHPDDFIIATDLKVATLIVDDLVESGKTTAKHREQNRTAMFQALVIKNAGDPWVTFPWEASDPLKDNEDIVVRLLELLGEDPNREGLKETPHRFLKAMREVTEGYKEDPKTILAKTFNEPTDQMIVVSDIDFWSTCEHHLLPFHGKVTVGYIPSESVIGLSKIPRLVQAFAKRLQVQERLTRQIAEALETELKPRGVGVIVKGQHLCMCSRGIKSSGWMTTSELKGFIKDDAMARAEFLDFDKRR